MLLKYLVEWYSLYYYFNFLLKARTTGNKLVIRKARWFSLLLWTRSLICPGVPHCNFVRYFFAGTTRERGKAQRAFPERVILINVQ